MKFTVLYRILVGCVLFFAETQTGCLGEYIEPFHCHYSRSLSCSIYVVLNASSSLGNHGNVLFYTQRLKKEQPLKGSHRIFELFRWMTSQKPTKNNGGKQWPNQLAFWEQLHNESGVFEAATQKSTTLQWNQQLPTYSLCGRSYQSRIWLIIHQLNCNNRRKTSWLFALEAKAMHLVLFKSIWTNQ